MSDLLNKASLVMVPSGYKEDTVYSVVPSDGSGDLSFTRASNGTRINSAGLVEVCPWNLLQQSENFPNAIWTKSTLTFNSTVTAPNGTSTAQNYSTAGAYAYALQTITVSSGEYYTVSCYLKYTSGVGSISIGYTDAPSNNFIRVDANLINGTIGSVSYGGNGANGTATITSVGDGWYRVTVSGTLTIGSAGLIVSNLALGATTFSIWGAQLNIGSTAKPYFPTTDRLNVPRLTYQNGGGGCPSLLLEKQSTNLCTYSEDLSNGVYTQSNVSVSANTSVSPDGTSNADTITSSAASPQLISPAVSFASSTNVSLFVKYVSQKYVQLFSGGAFGDYVNFDIESGAVGSNGGTTTNAQIQSFGNGWYRISATFGGYTGATTGRIGFVDSLSAGWNALTSTTSKSIYGWGFQIEASSYPTSYIPTTSSSATRVADLSTSDTIQTAQTFAGDFTFFVDFVSFTTTDALGPTNQMIIGGGNQSLGATYKSYFWITQNAIILVGDNETTMIAVAKIFTANQRYKLLVKRNGTTLKIFCDGVQVSSSATSSLSITIRSIGWGYNSSYIFNGLINQVVLSATGFSDADCQSLTTL